MRIAVIDIGSYSCRLSIADIENGLTHIYQEGNITSLSSGLKDSGLLQKDRMEETLRVLEEYLKRVREFKVDAVVAVGTQALRKAKNAQDFLGMVKECTGLDIRVITPQEEGRYSFLAVAYSLKPEGRFCIVDQGGGSTEYACGRGFNPDRIVSLPFGIVNLTEEFLHNDPPLNYELESLKNFLDEEIFRIKDECHILVGLGGTITTLAALEYGVFPYDPSAVHGRTLSLDSVMFWLETLSSMKEEQRIKSFPQIEPKRAKVIIPGILIFYRTMVIFGKKEILVSDWGLKEGIIVSEYLKRKKEEKGGE
ncbi:Ppx/GppA phosphatase family protein [Hydrogenobacter thermophilus]|uniref:Ppx/GppA phosphatase family protein n=1 Tax=Hydrogenobacter thermophilus TaxID=940 RepID=UPI0030F962FC